MTASHVDPGCTVQVGDEPNVRAAHRLVTPGMDVRSQDTWPTLRLDAKAVNGLLGRFLPAGFYYKTFIHPRRLWPAYEQVLRGFAHGGVVSSQPPTGDPTVGYQKRHTHPGVLVAGGGPAGMAAAVSAAGSGARVLLVEEEHQLGGHLRWGTAPELAALQELRDQVTGSPSIEVLTDSVVLGRYDGHDVAVLRRGLPGVHERLVKARPGTMVVAAGPHRAPS